MSNRSMSISMAAAVAVFSTTSQTSAQSTSSSPNSGSVSAKSAPANAAAAPADKEAAALAAAQRSRKSAPPRSDDSVMGVKIEYRDPVRREVPPKLRDGKRTAQPRQAPQAVGQQAAPTSPPAITSASPAANSAAAANNAAASDASAAMAGRKAWPVVVGAGTAGTQPGAQAGGDEASLHMWSKAEIDQAKAACTKTLKGVDVAMQPEDPIKQGECGSPVLFRVTSVGRAPSVELSPPVLLTCEMIASLDRWIKRDVQPQARTRLGGPLVKIETMSSYSCRNAYGRSKSRLSEHGKANAIDISGFATARDSTSVLAHWGPTARDERAIATKPEAERVPSAQSTSPPASPRSVARGSGSANTIPSPPSGGTIPIPSIPGVIVSDPGRSNQFGGSALGYAPSRLGGPKPPETPKPVPGDSVSREHFLKEIHASACKHFGTVLGPEANNAHRNHFHFDMADRPRGNFCQ